MAMGAGTQDAATGAWVGRLRRECRGQVLTDAYARGRYATDASIYQILPAGVVLPMCDEDVTAALQVAAEAGLSVTARGAGTSQGGQAIGDGLVIDFSRHLNRIERIDPEARSARVQPGVVLDRLNAALKPHGLFFPVEPSTASRCTIGGMAGNNSSGARSIVYGKTVDNVTAIDALLADGSALRFEPMPANLPSGDADPRGVDLVQRVRDIAIREAGEIERRFPKVLRRVGGYNLDTVSTGGHNMAHLLVGSEGTLALSTGIELALARLPEHRVLGVCHFPSFREAMESARPLVELGPTAVELVDHTLIALGREIPLFRDSLAKFVRGRPGALLLVEFAGGDRAALERKLAELDEAMASFGLADAVVRATEPALQKEIWEVRKAGLNIMMSMKSAGKPVSFIEDCAVPLEHFADYTAGIDEIFARHGKTGTWYAHAAVGCLHVRPILDMRDSGDVKAMREIAEEAFALVRKFKGSHSG
ncbi:MAG: FAD-binding oxidoreductase, partial [Inquilinus sp.]|nr:FAD-binding oxidoreductase [Inquilinus sp.]